MGAIIEVLQNNQTVTEVATEEDGRYSITLKNGKYLFKTMYSSYKTDISTVKLTGSEYNACLKLKLDGTHCGYLDIDIYYKVPLIDYNAPNKKVYTSDEIEHMAH
jgi:hypothetical protein